MGSARVRIRPDTSGFDRELENGTKGSFKKLAAGAAGAFAAVGAGTLFSGVISGAADAEQSLGGVQAVFKNYADSVVANSKTADRALGLSANSYRELSTLIGSQLKNAGVPMDQLGGKTNDLIKQGADLAAMFGGTTQDAVAALSSALKGEMDPIEKYGISLNDAALKAEAAALGIDVVGGSLSNSQRAMAVMSLVNKQGADALGAFGREAETAAGKQQRATAQFENMKTAVGEKLLPVFTSLMGFLGERLIPGLETLGRMAGQAYNILFKGDFTGGPLQEDSPFVNGLFKVRDFMVLVKDGATQMYDILFKGDFTGGPFQEDAPFVNGLFKVREFMGLVRDGAVQMFDILFRGDYNGGPLGEEDSWLVDKLFDIREAFITLKDGAVQMFNILFKGDFTGGPLGEDSEFVDRLFSLRDGILTVVNYVRENFLPVLGQLRDFIVTRVLPVVSELARFFVDNVLPALAVVGGYIIDKFTPIFQSLAELFVENILPAVQKLIGVFLDFLPQLQIIAAVIGVVAGAVIALALEIGSRLIPIILDVAGFLIDVLAGAITFVIKFIDGLVTGISWLVESFQTINDKVEEVAAWVTDKFQALQVAIGIVFDTIVRWMTEKFTSARDAVVEIAQNVWDWVVDRFTGLRDGVILLLTFLRDRTVELFTDQRDRIVNLAQNVWDWVVERFTRLRDASVSLFTNARDLIVAVFTDQRDKLVNLAQNIWDWLVARFTGLRNAASTIFTNIKDAVIGAFTVLRDTVASLAQNVWDWVVDKFSRMRDAVSSIFNGIKDAAGNIWGSIKDSFVSGINGVIDLINKFLDVVNNIAGKVGINLGLKVDRISTVALGGYAQGTTQGGGRTLYRADGGIIPGSSPHDRADNIPAMLTANEFVQPVNAVRYYGADAMEMIRKRQIPREMFQAFADGGLVAFGRRIQSMGAKVSRHSAFDGVTPRSGHGKTSLHYTDNAIDVNTRPGESALEQRELDVFAQMARDAGFRTIWRTKDHFNHLHVDNGPGSSIGQAGGGGGIIRQALGALAQAAVDPIKSGITSATSSFPLLQVMGGAANKAIQAVVDSIRKKDEEMAAAEPAGGGSFTGTAAGGVQQWAGTVSRALSMMGQPQNLVQTVLRRMNQESGGNARAVNNWDINAKRGTPSKGLMQVIDPTFRANAFPGYNRDIFDPLSNVLASMRYALGRYGSLPAAYNRAGGYANGTTLASRGLHLVGERGPELVGFRGGEKVLTAPRTRAALGGAEPLIGGDLNIHVGGDSTVRDGLEETVFQLRKIKRGG